MEKQTQIYLLVATGGMLYGTSAVAVYLSKDEAEFEAWRRNNNTVSRYMYGNMSEYSNQHYSVSTVLVLKNEKDKTYAKYITEKKARLEKEIESKRACRDKDITGIAELETELIGLDTK